MMANSILRQHLYHLFAVTIIVLLRLALGQIVCDVLNFGAVGDGVHNDRAAIQRAIDAEAPNACATVLLPTDHVFLSTPLFLRSDLTLRVDGTLRADASNTSAQHWPSMYTRREGVMQMGKASLINGGYCLDADFESHVYEPLRLGDQCKQWRHLRNVAITGSGVIDGGEFAPWKESNQLHKRPTLIGMVHVTGLSISAVHLRRPTFWALHILFCDQVHVTGVDIKTKELNGDGIDPDSSSNVLIENSRIFSEDDLIAIKSGKDEDGRLVGIPAVNITVRNMDFHGGRGIAIGSETSAGVRNVTFFNNTLVGGLRAVRIKSRRDRGGVVEDILYDGLLLQHVQTAISIDMLYNNRTEPPDMIDSSHLPIFRRITIRNVRSVAGTYGAAEAGDIICLEESPCTDLSLRDINIQGKMVKEFLTSYAFGKQENVSPTLALNAH